ncbi:Hypothetical predicted protein [Pelobates cultripes]|uniref:Uncharacterized protein n=1 Tax=Pelobates cultripes TaxID=61616 RepID=A0AAD1TLX6_PELCU|nr:Hypothetical predicted protein [Pelobates cultripes]
MAEEAWLPYFRDILTRLNRHFQKFWQRLERALCPPAPPQLWTSGPTIPPANTYCLPRRPPPKLTAPTVGKIPMWRRPQWRSPLRHKATTRKQPRGTCTGSQPQKPLGTNQAATKGTGLPLRLDTDNATEKPADTTWSSNDP